MENNKNEDYSIENLNNLNIQITDSEKPILNTDENLQQNHEEFIDNDPNSFYKNDKNSNPQNSEYAAEAETSNNDENEEYGFEETDIVNNNDDLGDVK